MKNRFYLAFFVIVFISLIGWTAHAQLQKSSRQSWEYVEVQLSGRVEATATLNQFGAQGWELVGVTSGCPSDPGNFQPCGYWAYFKRPR